MLAFQGCKVWGRGHGRRLHCGVAAKPLRPTLFPHQAASADALQNGLEYQPPASLLQPPALEARNLDTACEAPPVSVSAWTALNGASPEGRQVLHRFLLVAYRKDPEPLECSSRRA